MKKTIITQLGRNRADGAYSAFGAGLSGTPSASAESIKGMSYTATFKFGKF